MTNVHETIWKSIPGFEGLYEASNTGLIRSLPKKYSFGLSVDRVMKPMADKDGYLKLKLIKNGKGYYLRVHRLIALAFVSKPAGCNVIDHINNVKYDNRAENLRWVTIKQNTQFAFADGLINIPGKPVNQLTLDDIFIKRFEKIQHVKHDGFNRECVKDVLTKRQKTHKGFKWEYAKM